MLGLCCLLSIPFACQQPSSSQSETESTVFQPAKVQDFPLITLVAERKLKMDAYTLHFSLSHLPELRAYPNDLVPWINPLSFNESAGTFISYLRDNDPLRLDKPNIRLSYIKKEGAQASTDMLLAWLDEQLIDLQAGHILQGLNSLTTKAGMPALTKEFYTPSLNGRSSKYMAFAYLDASRDYLLGFNLTAIDSADFAQVRPLFYSLVKSYEE